MFVVYCNVKCYTRAIFKEYHHCFHTDHPERMYFPRWYIDQCLQEVPFPILFMDETYFTRGGVFNHQNADSWAGENSLGIRPYAAQHRFLIACLSWYDRQSFKRVLLVVSNSNICRLSHLFGWVPTKFMWTCVSTCQTPYVVSNDGGSPHYGRCVRENFNQLFGHRWIGWGGLVLWSPCSPD